MSTNHELLERERRRTQTLSEEVLRLQAALNDLQNKSVQQAQNAEEERTKFTRSLLERGNQLTSLMAENAKLHELLKAANGKSDYIAQQIDAVALNGRRKDAALGASQAALSDLQQKYEEVCAVLADLHSELERVKVEAEATRAELRNSRAREAELLSQLQDTGAGASSLSLRARDADAESQHLRAANEDLHRSFTETAAALAAARNELLAVREASDEAARRHQEQVQDLNRRLIEAGAIGRTGGVAGASILRATGSATGSATGTGAGTGPTGTPSFSAQPPPLPPMPPHQLHHQQQQHQPQQLVGSSSASSLTSTPARSRSGSNLFGGGNASSGPSSRLPSGRETPQQHHHVHFESPAAASASAPASPSGLSSSLNNTSIASGSPRTVITSATLGLHMLPASSLVASPDAPTGLKEAIDRAADAELKLAQMEQRIEDVLRSKRELEERYADLQLRATRAESQLSGVETRAVVEARDTFVSAAEAKAQLIQKELEAVRAELKGAKDSAAVVEKGLKEELEQANSRYRAADTMFREAVVEREALSSAHAEISRLGSVEGNLRAKLEDLQAQTAAMTERATVMAQELEAARREAAANARTAEAALTQAEELGRLLVERDNAALRLSAEHEAVTSEMDERMRQAIETAEIAEREAQDARALASEATANVERLEKRVRQLSSDREKLIDECDALSEEIEEARAVMDQLRASAGFLPSANNSHSNSSTTGGNGGRQRPIVSRRKAETNEDDENNTSSSSNLPFSPGGFSRGGEMKGSRSAASGNNSRSNSNGRERRKPFVPGQVDASDVSANLILNQQQQHQQQQARYHQQQGGDDNEEDDDGDDTDALLMTTTSGSLFSSSSHQRRLHSASKSSRKGNANNSSIRSATNRSAGLLSMSAIDSQPFEGGGAAEEEEGDDDDEELHTAQERTMANNDDDDEGQAGGRRRQQQHGLSSSFRKKNASSNGGARKVNYTAAKGLLPSSPSASALSFNPGAANMSASATASHLMMLASSPKSPSANTIGVAAAAHQQQHDPAADAISKSLKAMQEAREAAAAVEREKDETAAREGEARSRIVALEQELSFHHNNSTQLQSTVEDLVSQIRQLREEREREAAARAAAEAAAESALEASRQVNAAAAAFGGVSSSLGPRAPPRPGGTFGPSSSSLAKKPAPPTGRFGTAGRRPGLSAVPEAPSRMGGGARDGGGGGYSAAASRRGSLGGGSGPLGGVHAAAAAAAASKTMLPKAAGRSDQSVAASNVPSDEERETGGEDSNDNDAASVNAGSTALSSSSRLHTSSSKTLPPPSSSASNPTRSSATGGIGPRTATLNSQAMRELSNARKSVAPTTGGSGAARGSVSSLGGASTSSSGGGTKKAPASAPAKPSLSRRSTFDEGDIDKDLPPPVVGSDGAISSGAVRQWATLGAEQAASAGAAGTGGSAFSSPAPPHPPVIAVPTTIDGMVSKMKQDLEDTKSFLTGSGGGGGGKRSSGDDDDDDDEEDVDDGKFM